AGASARSSMWRAMSVPRFAEQSIERESQHLRASLVTVLRGGEVAADEQREDQHAAGLDIVLIHAELPEQRAHVPHAPVVDPAHSLGDVAVATRPVPKCQIYRQ